jgi:hypothetical protein
MASRFAASLGLLRHPATLLLGPKRFFSSTLLVQNSAGSKPCRLKHSSDQATGRTAEAALPEKPVMRLNGQFLFA